MDQILLSTVAAWCKSVWCPHSCVRARCLRHHAKRAFSAIRAYVDGAMLKAYREVRESLAAGAARRLETPRTLTLVHLFFAATSQRPSIRLVGAPSHHDTCPLSAAAASKRTRRVGGHYSQRPPAAASFVGSVKAWRSSRQARRQGHVKLSITILLSPGASRAVLQHTLHAPKHGRIDLAFGDVVRRQARHQARIHVLRRTLLRWRSGSRYSNLQRTALLTGNLSTLLPVRMMLVGNSDRDLPGLVILFHRVVPPRFLGLWSSGS